MIYMIRFSDDDVDDDDDDDGARFTNTEKVRRTRVYTTIHNIHGSLYYIINKI